MTKYKFTTEEITEAVTASYSLSGAMRALGYEKIEGGSVCCFRNRLDRLGIDRSHFTGKSWAKGTSSNKKKCTADILIHTHNSTRRTQRYQLFRALVDVGRSVQCEECLVFDTYNNKPLLLQIDHKDGNWRNNTADNLRFLCPNCHSQTDNYGNKKRTKS